jgi:hypothetical protein
MIGIIQNAFSEHQRIKIVIRLEFLINSECFIHVKT